MAGECGGNPISDTICGLNLQDTLNQMKTFEGLMKLLGVETQNLKSAIKDLTSMPAEAMSMVDDKIQEGKRAVDKVLDKFEDQVGDLISDVDGAIPDCAKKIMDCLGIPSLEDLLGFSMDSIDVPKLADAFEIDIDPFSPLDNLLADAVEALENILPVELIDSILGFGQCLQDCPGASGVDALDYIGIETEMTNVGLDITGAVDLDGDAFADTPLTDAHKKYIKKITDGKKELKSYISQKEKAYESLGSQTLDPLVEKSEASKPSGLLVPHEGPNQRVSIGDAVKKAMADRETKQKQNTAAATAKASKPQQSELTYEEYVQQQILAAGGSIPLYDKVNKRSPNSESDKLKPSSIAV